MPVFLNSIAQDVYDLCRMNDDWEITNAQFMEILKQHGKLPEDEPETNAYERRAYIGVMNDERDIVIKEFKTQKITLTFVRRGVFRLDSYENGLAVKWQRNASRYERRTHTIARDMVKTLEENYGEMDPDLKLDLLEQITQGVRMTMANAKTCIRMYSLIRKEAVARQQIEQQSEQPSTDEAA